MHRLALPAFALGFVLCSPAWAANVEVVQGQISINHGQGYKPVRGKSDAFPGDSVMASPNGSGKIVYEDGCVVEVKPGAVVTVEPTSPCQAGASNSGSRRGYIIGGVVVAGVVGGVIALAGGGDGDDGGGGNANDETMTTMTTMTLTEAKAGALDWRLAEATPRCGTV